MAKEDEDIIQKLKQTLESMKKSAIEFEKTMEGVDAETRKGRKEEIKELKEKLELLKQSTTASEEQKKEAEKTLKAIERQNKILTEQYQVTGRIFQEFSKTSEQYKNFLFTTAAQYNVAQEIAKEYKSLTKSIGLGKQSAELLSRSFKDALPDVLEMGLKSEDLGRIYEEMAENSGRITPLSSDDAERIAAVAAGTGIMASDASNMAEAFNLMGLSAEQMEENLMETYKSAQGMGLNATKVIKTLQTNLRTMQSYSFVGGVKGMTEMAKQAVKMRLDVSDVLAMSDKFYQPEAAIEAAANLQMLGGDIAEAFGDPFETMYLARNKPEELAKKVGEMTENMMQFNEETGEYEFPAEVRMQLKAAGEQLGINTDKMIEMARQTSKIKDIKMKFNMSGLDEDAKDSIASLATFSKDRNEYVIKHDGKELGLDEINQGMAEEIMKANQSDSDTFRDIAINTQTMSENLANFMEGQKARAVGTIDLYETTVAEMQEPLNQLKEGMVNFTEAYVDRGKEFVSDMFAKADDSVLSEAMGELGDLTNLLKDKTIKSFEELTEKINIFNKQSELEENQGGGETEEDPAAKCAQKNGVYANGKCMKGAVEIPLAKGGLVNKPINALVGEAGPEAVIPLSKLENYINASSKIEFGKLDISGRIEIISPDGSAKNMDMESIKPQLIKTIVSHLNGTFRNGGVPSSKESTDYMAT